MKKLSVLFLCVSAFVCHPAWGVEQGDTVTKCGRGQRNCHHQRNCTPGQQYGNEVLDSLSATGSVCLNGTTVTGQTVITGSLRAVGASLNSLKVSDRAWLKDCIVTNGAEIGGRFGARNTRIQNGLTCSGRKVVLKGCTVDSITIKNCVGCNGLQIVILQAGTIVTGDIVFEGGNGLVQISPDSHVDGTIIGAKN